MRERNHVRSKPPSPTPGPFTSHAPAHRARKRKGPAFRRSPPCAASNPEGLVQLANQVAVMSIVCGVPVLMIAEPLA
jgi:hypothetical protein